MRRPFIPFCLLVLQLSAQAADTFELENTFPRTATFQFYASEYRRWETPELKLNYQEYQPRTLQSYKPYTVMFYTDEGYCERLDDVDFHSLIGGVQGARITLERIYSDEERTRTVQVAKSRTEERTQTYTVTKWVPETRTRIVRRRDPRTGRWIDVEEQYTVMAPVQEQRERTYTVTVPYTETIERKYTVRVPGARMVVKAGGMTNSLDFRSTALSERNVNPIDDRNRYLGVRLQNSPGGPVVVVVDAGSPATRLTRLGGPSTQIYRLVPRQSVITEVNGATINTSEELVRAIHQSPPIAVLKVLNRGSRQSANYEAHLELR